MSLPKRALNELDIVYYARGLPNFRGVFMIDKLPLKPRRTECGIINLDKSTGNGTHWTAYYKYNNNKILYFDSYGNLRPPRELVDYLGSNIEYNYKRFQKDNTVNCGHLCLKFLYDCASRIPFKQTNKKRTS